MKIDAIIEKKFLVRSTIFTLIMAIISCISFGFQLNNYMQLISLSLFLVGICTILLQLIVFNYQIHSKVHIVDENKVIRPHTVFKDLQDEIGEKIDSKNVKSMTIICFGTNGFGNLIPQLTSKSSPIIVDILVCSPDSKHIVFKETDQSAIEHFLTICKNNNKVTVTRSLIPPTIRACILYSENKKPIWASMQTYYFEDNGNHRALNYHNFYAVVAEENNYPLLNEMVTVIENEFERLIKYTLKEKKLKQSQIDVALHCRKNKKITKDEYKTLTKCMHEETIKNELDDLVGKNVFELVSETKGTITIEYYTWKL